ncbi:phosphatidylinositol 3- and 4-kinase family protein (macronuclear) [Tetrahymena thermophila SB210]|uniref:Serine/threonine-protein kinase TOR n=1 Tax=Tetrahymena thermophila (strain SB210) TaxID=312017 RepID=I7ML63_TETTS|nr:phosphatidylinositol 3- and 4-kinase family protein [Tetrahymena thermophila SB210]EAS01249.1 phosphatidylinositol 3- and 4-kinase family protein [Tetrahymena thermophila SB210]|eukprot:XP_001021494.1 phosphatidylinositol 3- and 4-kinase family protein [Tetrahymena thermophila SB210]
MSHIMQEISKLFEQFKKAKNQESERLAADLQQLYLKNNQYYDEIYHGLIKLINSNDINEKYNSLIGIEQISYVVQEDQYLNLWSKFNSLVFQLLEQTGDEKVIKKSAEVYGRLLRLGGTRITNLLTDQIQKPIHWIFKNSGDNKKFSGLLVLKELLEQASFVTFKQFISNTEDYRTNLWNLIKHKTTLLREAALSFFDVLLKQISLKEQDIQDREYNTFFTDICQSMNARQEEVVIGNISALKILVTYPNSEQFNDQQFSQMCMYVLSKKDENSNIQKTVIEALPALAKFKKQAFAEKFFIKTTEFLLQRINPPKAKSITHELIVSYYDTLNKISQCIDSTIYAKLPENMKDLVFQSIQNITRQIRQDLQEKKPYISFRIQCLMSIIKNFQHKYQDLINDEDLLINNILFNGLYPQSIEFLKHIQKYNRKERTRTEVSSSIQYRLLLCIITILSKHKNLFPQSLNPNNDKDKNFYQKLILNTDKTLSTDEKAIANAIQTLSTFGFSNYENELANFVKDNVLDYLDNKNKNIRKAAAKAGCLLYVKKERGQSISKNIMYEILEKFMSVAISDSEDEIRQTMLKSLNENFDQYLNEPNYLKKLFLCVNDSNTQVQQLVLTILCRLSRYNPSDIIPFLKKTLFEFLSQLKINNLENEKQMINLLSSLTCLIKNGPELVRPHSQSIANILLNFLKDQKITNNMIPELLKTFSQLSSLGDNTILLYMDEIFPIFLQAMQDKSSTAKREAAVKSLVDILKYTGFVVLPYYKYPSFLEIILSLMKNEVNVEMRQQCMRLIGCLGAIDYFYYKKVSDKVRNRLTASPSQDNRQLINDIIKVSLKKKFKYFKKLSAAKQQESSSILTKQLHQYYEDIILLENFKQKKMYLKLSNIQAEIDYNLEGANSLNIYQQPQKKDNRFRDQNMIEKLYSKQEIDEEIKMLLQSPTVISLTDEDYYSKITIKALLKILCDQSLNEHHSLAVQTLSCIIGVLQTRTKNFLDLLIPIFIKIVRQDMLRDRENILQLIQKIILNCGRYYDQEYLDPILNVFLEFGQDPQYYKICFSILENLIEFQKRNLRHYIEPIIRLINNVIYKPQIDESTVLQVIKIYTLLAELLDSNLHLIVPFLCNYISKDTSQTKTKVKSEIINLFNCFANSCCSTVQFLSLIVDSILINLEQSKDAKFINECMNTVVVFIYIHKNQFLVYLTKLNYVVKQKNIQHIAYQKCVDIFLNNGNLDDVSSQIEPEFQKIVGEIKTDQPPQQQELFNSLLRKIDSDKLAQVFSTSSNTSKEDWNQWIRKTSVELLNKSPNFVLTHCKELAEIYEELQAELFNISFVCVWSQLKDHNKTFIKEQFSKAINPENNVPINILQTILNLTEFMQHDKEGIPIENTILGDLAERCLAYAKALYFRENEFETANIQIIESLISLYTNLGQREAAKGLLQNVQQQLRLDVNESWYERLHQWEYALDDYRVRQLNIPEQSFFVPKMRCLNALSDWEQLIKNTQEENNPEHRKQVMHLAANAAMNLGNWELLENFCDNLPEENSQDKQFWQAAISISKGQYEEAKNLISESINKLDSQVSGLLLESYSRAYESILRLQQLFEMQEIIDIKEFEEKVNSTANREGLIKGIQDAEIEQKRKQLRDIWADRLYGNPKDIDTWQKILSVRQLYLSKKDDLNTWLKFCRLALKNNQMHICKKTLEELYLEYNKDSQLMPAQLQLADLECNYQMSITKEKEICEKMEEILQSENKIDNKLTAKMYLKMGNWIRDKTDELNSFNMKKIGEFYQKAKDFKPDYYKTWHHFGLLNFDAINMKQDDTIIEQKRVYIKNALEGFMRSITLGTSSEHKSPYILQDSLRLLSIIFEYGDLEDIHNKFLEDFKQIDNRAWIEVVPQIIARLSTTKKSVQHLLHSLLTHIAQQHPQALIYPLTVALKSKIQIRQQAASKIIENIKTHSPLLINQALLISQELNRTAILIKEQWLEGIKEAWERYTIDKGAHTHLIKILQGLHEMMKVPPESLSEISFHQNFGGEIFEAESWLERYKITEDAICLCQAFDIYYRIYSKLDVQLKKLEFVYLENVSPKLLETKNCEVSIPGLYKPTRPIVKISCFQPKLEVLFSKMNPRKLFVYGSDSKEYHFLLKGREDIRQDERVMQLFALINRLLHNNPETEKKDLNIQRYSIIPLSINTGLLGWVHNCDTLQVLIREYRKAYHIRENPEYNLMEQKCSNYSVLPLPNKVEIFRYIMENTKGEELKKILWLKSPNSEIWLERRTNYTRSLATMSIAGYILGLGDRHPSNIMLQRYTGKIVHIDFGDCFEVAMRREKFPEKVPFRLTRMLVNAMEACQIEGNYRNTCELVLKVIRENKESLIAVLEAFVYDPLFYWRLITISGEEQGDKANEKKEKGDAVYQANKKRESRPQSLLEVSMVNQVSYVGSIIQQGTSQAIQKYIKKAQKSKINNQNDIDRAQSPKNREKDIQEKYYNEEKEQPQENLNKKAVEVMDRIKKKLNGKDFQENESLTYTEQVSKLINQATSHENICQAYIGWCPFW